jgi:hypothetical protein
MEWNGAELSFVEGHDARGETGIGACQTRVEEKRKLLLNSYNAGRRTQHLT